MLRRNATRQEGRGYDRVPRDRGSAYAFMQRGCAVLRGSVVLLIAAAALLPVAYAQHGRGGGFHPAAPHSSAPHPSVPRVAPQSHPAQMRAPARAATPAQQYRPPAAQGYATRPTNEGAPQQNRELSPGQPQRPANAAQPSPYQNNASPGNNAQQNPRNQYAVPPPNGRGNQQHLGNWLQQHQGESLAGQENALRQEPGFNRLPQQQQDRLVNRLQQLNAMPPQQRQRTLGRIENMEHLSPDRRQAVRNSAQELGAMDPARKEQVRGAFRQLRDLPPAERQQQLDSPAFRSQYSDHERQMLGNLLSVEPYSPQ